MRRYPPHRRYVASLAVGICLVLAGCGGSSGQTVSTNKSGGQATPGSGEKVTTNDKQGNTKPCDLLTVDELKAITGFTAHAGKAEVAPGISKCDWPIDYGSTGEAKVSVDLAAAKVSSLTTPEDPSKWVTVSGVGDEALWSMVNTKLYVHGGQQDFSIFVGVSDDAKQQVIARALALKVLERL